MTPRAVAFALASGAVFACLGAPALLLSIQGLGIVALEGRSSSAVAIVAVVLAAYCIAGVLGGLLFSLAGAADGGIAEVATDLARALDPVMAAMIADSALGDTGVDAARIERLLALPANSALHSPPGRWWLAWPARVLHRWSMQKVLEAVRLSMVLDLPRWSRARGESRVTVATVEAFARERLVHAVTGNLRSRMRGLRQRLLASGAVAVLGPIAVVSALLFTDPGRHRLDRLAATFGPASIDQACERLTPSPGPTARPPAPPRPRRSERPLPHSNVVTLGSPGPGNARLTSAITRVLYRQGLATYVSPECLAIARPAAPGQIALVHAEYQSAARHYAHVELRSQIDLVKALITRPLADGAIVAVSAVSGLTPEIEEQVELARQVGVRPVAVFVDEADRVTDPERTAREVRHWLGGRGIAVPDRHVILGSARRALEDDPSALGAPSVRRLIEILDAHLPDVPRRSEGPFLMAVEDHFPRHSTIVAGGQVDRGAIRVGDEVEIVGLEPTRRAQVAFIEMFRKRLDQAVAGDKVHLGLGGIERVERGQVLATPGSIAARQRFAALFYAHAAADGGRRLPFSTGYRPQVYVRVTDVTGTFTLPAGVDHVRPGEHVRLIVELARPAAVETGLRFLVREGGQTVGAGVVLDERSGQESLLGCEAAGASG